MEKFLKRKSPPSHKEDDNSSSSNQYLSIINLENLVADPGQRPRIMSYHPNDRDQIRTTYLLRGPCQPHGHDFPLSVFGNQKRQFNSPWFSEYPNWLEYSVRKDAAYCLCCYLFKQDIRSQAGGDSFVGEGFSNWKKKEKLQLHMGS